MASSSLPNKRQKSKKPALSLPPQRQNSNRSEKTRKNQDPSPATRSGSLPGELRRNDDHLPWGSIPVQQRLFHNFAAPTKNSPVEARRNLIQPPQMEMEIPFKPPSRPKLSSVFPQKDKATAGTKSPPIAIATARQDKIGTVGSPTSASSSSSNERSAERKSRRHQLKKLPSVQQRRPTRVKERGGGAGHRRGSDSSSVEAMDEMSYHSYATSNMPYPMPMGIYPPPLALYPSPPPFMYPATYMIPPQPELHSRTDRDAGDAEEQSSLKEIKEDEGEDDIKGFDDFVMY